MLQQRDCSTSGRQNKRHGPIPVGHISKDWFNNTHKLSKRMDQCKEPFELRTRFRLRENAFVNYHLRYRAVTYTSLPGFPTYTTSHIVSEVAEVWSMGSPGCFLDRPSSKGQVNANEFIVQQRGIVLRFDTVIRSLVGFTD